jgi:hypothetical protein
MDSEYRPIPFRWILPAAQIIVAILCFWPSRYEIAWQIRTSIAAYKGAPPPLLRIPNLHRMNRDGTPQQGILVIDPQSIVPSFDFPWIGPGLWNEGWRYWTPLIINFPAAMLSIPYAAVSQDKMEWTPKGMSFWYWRAVSWPTIGILFWWLAGRGVETFLAALRRGVISGLGLVGLASGVYFVLVGGICALLYFCATVPLEGPDGPSLGLMLFSGIVWILFGATTICAFVIQRRIRRRSNHATLEPGAT